MELSIITINRNNANGLEKTIRSVLSQTYQGFEYVVVDGASTDRSVEVLQCLLGADAEASSAYVEVTYMDRCHLVKWISEQDTGIYNAMNKGIKKSHGDYLLFLNSGDFLVDPNVLEKVFCEDYVEDLLCARCNVSEYGKVVWTSPVVPQTITLGWLYFHGLMHQSTFIRKELFNRIGLYDESFKWLADIQFWYKAIIFGDATTLPIDVITSDYNHEGASSVIGDNPRFKQEAKWAETQPVLKHVFPDLKDWAKDKSVSNEYGWISNQKILRKILRLYKRFLIKIRHASL